MFYSAQMIHQCWINNKNTHTADISTTIIESKNDEAAYKKATKIAKAKTIPYKNMNNNLVVWKFIGLADLQEIIDDKIEDGTEVFSELGQITNKKHLKSLIRPKKKLLVFNSANTPKNKKIIELIEEEPNIKKYYGLK